MEWYQREVTELERSVAQQTSPHNGVFCYGSSSIRLWDSLQNDFPDIPVINAGFGGSTLEACVHFFSRIVVPCRPPRWVLYAGDNDLGDGISPESVCLFLQNFRRLMQKELPQVQWIAMSVKPSPSRWNLRDKWSLHSFIAG